MTKFIFRQTILENNNTKAEELQKGINSFSDVISVQNSARFLPLSEIDQDTLNLTSHFFKKYNKAWKSLAVK